MIKEFKVPHTLVLLYGMIVFAYILTWILPAGMFEIAVDAKGHEVVVPGTFTLIESVKHLPIWILFTSIPRGLAEASEIIFFVFIVGGALAVIRSSGAIDAGMGKLLRLLGGYPAVLIFVGMFAFTAGSSSIGMAEEYIPLIGVLILLCAGMRMDAVTAVGVMVVGYGVGYGVAALNPFTLHIAQNIAGLELSSGMEYRLLITIPFFVLGFYHVWRYARKVRKDPAASLVADVPEAQAKEAVDHPKMTNQHVAVLLATLLTLVVLGWGIKTQSWYLVQLGGIFLALALVVGLIMRQSFDQMARIFTDGAAELAGTALIIGFARAIAIVLEDGQVLHTIVNALATPLQHVGAEISAVGMLAIQCVLNFFIPSGSGQAYVTMPLMAPIADLIGTTRQVAVLAFQMGDGFMNMIVPTNAVLMGILGIAGIPYGRWFRFIWPLTVQLFIAGSAALVIAVMIGYQ